MPRLRFLRHAALPGAWLLFVGLAIRSGRDPGYWHAFDPELAYPWRPVLAACALITAEVVALTLILRPWSYRRSWRRASLALLAWLLPTTWELAHSETHQPGYAYANLRFVLLMLPALLLLTLVSLAAARAREGMQRTRAKGDRIQP